MYDRWIMNVVQFFNEITLGEDKLSKVTHKICRNIIQGVDEETLRELREQVILDWYLSKLVNERLERQTPITRNSIHYNKSWREYLRDIQQRRVGCISLARKKLQSMFPYMEWQVQCKLLSFFLLEPTKGSRIWALNTLSSHWTLLIGPSQQLRKRWLRMVLHLWEQYKEREIALFIVKHADEESVLKLEQPLSEAIGYQKVALRLGLNPNYEVNQSALSHLEWFYVMAKLKHKVDPAVCEMIFAEILSKAVVRKKCPIISDDCIFSFALDDQVGLALWCLGELKQPGIIINFFYCDRKLQDYLTRSLNIDISQEEYWHLMCKEAPKYFSLPSLHIHKQEQLDELMNLYPVVREFTRRFGLECE